MEPISANRNPGFQDQTLLDSIRNSNSIAIHVRRGDYVTNIFARNAHGACSLDYYDNALNFIREREESLRYYVFRILQSSTLSAFRKTGFRIGFILIIYITIKLTDIRKSLIQEI